MNSNDIKPLVEQKFNAFLFDVALAPNNLFFQSYLLGKAREEGWKGTSYLDFVNLYLKQSLYNTPEDLKVLDFIKKRVGLYIGNVQERIGQDLVNTILGGINVLEDIIQPSIARAHEEGLDHRTVARELRKKTKNYFYDFERMAMTELNHAKNLGALNTILERNKGVDLEDIQVYFIGALDKGTCKYCKEMYHDGKSFKIYSLAEVLANGSPIGKKLKDESVPFMPPLHPRCKHLMVELFPNWKLDENGHQVFDKFDKEK